MKGLRDPRRRAALPPRPLGPLPADDGRTYDEPVRLLRRGRLAVGLGMILVAVLLIAVENLLGIHTAPLVRPAGVPAEARPLGIAQRTGTLRVNAKLLERQTVLGVQPAPAGRQYLIVAIQVVNGGTRIVTLASTDFRLLLNAAWMPGGSYPGRPLALSVTPGTTVVGFVSFLVPQPLPSTALRYTPRGGGGALTWRFL